MSTAKQNRSIAKLIVGAMSIDGSLSQNERQKVAGALQRIGMPELIGDVGITIEEDDGSFDMYEECNTLLEILGSEAELIAPKVFRIIADVIANDRFVSTAEASYLSAMARKLNIPNAVATDLFRQAVTERRSRLEIAAKGIDENIRPHLKELLSFPGAEELVGRAAEGSIDEMISQSIEEPAGKNLTPADLELALLALGLPATAKISDAQAVWQETIEHLNLPKLAALGETFVTSALTRIVKVNDAYRTILQFQQKLKGGARPIGAAARASSGSGAEEGGGKGSSTASTTSGTKPAPERNTGSSLSRVTPVGGIPPKDSRSDDE